MKLKDLNRRFAALATVTVIAVGGSIYSAAAASAADPGTSGDPLVTKSYVDEVVSNLMEIISKNGGGGTLPSSSDSGQSYVPVKVETGEVLIGGEGAEIILRSGEAVSYCEGEDGTVDVTTGQEYFNGTKLQKNHLIIVPRADGRGAKVTSQEAWFIVKGSYSIK